MDNIKITWYDQKLKTELDRRSKENSLIQGNDRYWHKEKVLPLIYAVSCVETTLLHSENKSTRTIYPNIMKAWGQPGCLEAMDDFLRDCLDKNLWIERMKRVRVNLERYEALPLSECHGWDYICEKHKENPDLQALIPLISDFVKEGFNCKSDKENGIYKVFPTEDPPWLFLAVNMVSLCEFTKFAQNEWRSYGTITLGDKVYDLDKIMKDEPTGRTHRKLVRVFKKCNNVLRHADKLLADAEKWYRCRVDPGSLEVFISNES